VLEPLDVGVSGPSGDGALAPTLTTLKSVDALGGWESAAAATASKRMDMSGQKTARTELELRRDSACGCRPPSS
jgi:hypothetical protein